MKYFALLHTYYLLIRETKHCKALGWNNVNQDQRVVEVFLEKDTKLEIILAKNQHTQRQSLNFDNWSSGKLSKIGHLFRQ